MTVIFKTSRYRTLPLTSVCVTTEKLICSGQKQNIRDLTGPLQNRREASPWGQGRSLRETSTLSHAEDTPPPLPPSRDPKAAPFPQAATPVVASREPETLGQTSTGMGTHEQPSKQIENPEQISKEHETPGKGSKKLDSAAISLRELETPAQDSRKLENTAHPSEEPRTSAQAAKELETSAQTAREMETAAQTARDLETSAQSARELETPPPPLQLMFPRRPTLKVGYIPQVGSGKPKGIRRVRKPCVEVCRIRSTGPIYLYYNDIFVYTLSRNIKSLSFS